MQTIRWIRIIFSTIFIILGLVFGIYFHIKENPPAIAIDSCTVKFANNGTNENLPFDDPRCSY